MSGRVYDESRVTEGERPMSVSTQQVRDAAKAEAARRYPRDYLWGNAEERNAFVNGAKWAADQLETSLNRDAANREDGSAER